MAWETDTAADQEELLAKVQAFLEGLSGPETWVTQRYSAGDELIIMAPGMAGDEEIYAGFKVFSDVGGDYFNFRLGGFTNYVSGNTFFNQPGANTKLPVLPVWDDPMTYWIAADGRHMKLVVKVSTVYEMCYLGFLDAYASPNQYPYPLFVGGSMAFITEPAAGSANWRWSYTGVEHRHFWEPITTINAGSQQNADSQAQLRMPNGAWRGFQCGFSSDYSPGSFIGGGALVNGPSSVTTTNAGIWPGVQGADLVGTQLDGDSFVVPHVLFSSPSVGDSAEQIGEFRGLLKTSGAGLAAENIVVLDGVDHLVVPNVFRSNRQDYALMRLA